MIERTRVLVAGGGPAGAMTAALLAREGFDVILCERDQFPRYHIGESLLTSAIPLLEFAGAAERVERHGFVKKRGAYFRVKRDQPAGHIDFGRLARYQYSYQVLRSEFDAILLDHARESGADVRECTAVSSVQFEGGRPVSADMRTCLLEPTGLEALGQVLCFALPTSRISGFSILAGTGAEPTYARWLSPGTCPSCRIWTCSPATCAAPT